MKQFVTLAVVALCAIAAQASPLCGGPGLLLCQPAGGLGGLGLHGGYGALELDAGIGYGHAPLGLAHLNLIKKLKFAPKPLLLNYAPVAPIALAPAPLLASAPLLAQAPVAPPAPLAPPQKLCGCLEPTCSCGFTKK